jgi:hypothetical protein
MARKTSHTVRCDGDGCKSFVDVETVSQVPEDWYSIAVADAAGRPKASFDMCSLKCVEKWAKARRQALPDARTNYVKKPCDYCTEEFSPQGMVLHMKSIHPEEYRLEQQTAP